MYLCKILIHKNLQNACYVKKRYKMHISNHNINMYYLRNKINLQSTNNTIDKIFN